MVIFFTDQMSLPHFKKFFFQIIQDFNKLLNIVLQIIQDFKSNWLRIDPETGFQNAYERANIVRRPL